MRVVFRFSCPSRAAPFAQHAGHSAISRLLQRVRWILTIWLDVPIKKTPPGYLTLFQLPAQNATSHTPSDHSEDRVEDDAQSQ